MVDYCLKGIENDDLIKEFISAIFEAGYTDGRSGVALAAAYEAYWRTVSDLFSGGSALFGPSQKDFKDVLFEIYSSGYEAALVDEKEHGSAFERYFDSLLDRFKD